VNRLSVFLMVLLAVARADALDAQILSPGKLAEAHSELEGIRNCTACHQLGQRGISPERCLECHTPLGTRIQEGRGFHASVQERICSECHKDHYGRDFGLRRVDEASFIHDDTGFVLEGGHADAACADCHKPAHIRDDDVVSFMTEHDALSRTYLGLSQSCLTCHEADDPHDGEFSDRSCDDCHEAMTWEEAPGFDHESTDYSLRGQHTSLECGECHQAMGNDVVTFAPLEHARCSSCHEDPHAGRMNGACSSCHDPRGWRSVSRSRLEDTFDHGTTTFALEGAHAAASCEACHRPGSPPRTELIRISYRAGTSTYTFPRPVSETCASCHRRYHAQPGSGDATPAPCTDCHTQDAWAPTTYRISRHNEETDFALTGAHAATPCTACHVGTASPPGDGAPATRFELHFASRDCSSCHEQESPHDEEFSALACDACHVTEAFEMAEFDHSLPAAVDFVSNCRTCHQDDDPHQDQFVGRECGTCHTTDGFVIADFSHDETDFPLDGAHQAAECYSCHVQETSGDGRTFTLYRPLGRACTDCHGVSP